MKRFPLFYLVGLTLLAVAPSMLAVVDTVPMYYSNGAPMQPGVDYTYVLYPEEEIRFQAPEGYSIFINGRQTNYCYNPNPAEPPYSTKTIHVRLVSSDGSFSGRSGTCTSLIPGELSWQIALGHFANGDPVPPIALCSPAATSDNWSSAWTPSALSVDTLAGSPNDWTKYGFGEYNYGGHRPASRFASNDTVVEVVELSSTSFELRLYHKSQYVWPATQCTGLPYLTYRVGRGATDASIVITRETRMITSPTDTSAPIVLTEETSMEKTGTWPNCTYTVKDWNVVGQSQQVERVLVSSGTSSLVNETLYTRVPGGSSVKTTQKTFQHFAWGFSPISITEGTINPNTTNITYYTDTPWGGCVKCRTFSGGGWEGYTYSNTGSGAPTAYGGYPRVYQRHRPFNGSPATPPSNFVGNTSGEVTTTNYAWPDMPAWDYASREQRINGTLVSDSTSEYMTGMGEYYDYQRKYSSRLDGSNSAAFSEIVLRDHTLPGRIVQTRSSNGLAEFVSDQMGDYYESGHYFIPNENWKALPRSTHSRTMRITGSSNSADGPHISSVMSEVDCMPSTAMYEYGGAPNLGIYLVANKSTMHEEIRDIYSRLCETQESVWNGSSWQVMAWEKYEYDFSNNVIRREKSNGEIYEASFLGLRKEWERGTDGVKLTYAYDASGRLTTTTKESAGSIAAIAKKYTYDAIGNVVMEETGYGLAGSLITTRQYDDTGRMTQEKVPGINPTYTSYNPGIRQTTTTLPNGSTRIETRNSNGALVSITGTAIIPEYHTYGIESNGARWTKINYGSSTSPRWVKTWTDWKGNTVKTERPGFGANANFVADNIFDPTTSRLIKTTVSTGQAPTLFTYGVMGQLTLTGLDLDNNGILQLGSNDRITGKNEYFFNDGTSWWQVQEAYTYPLAGSATQKFTTRSYTRISGYAGSLRAETHNYDAEGHFSRLLLEIDRASKTVTKKTEADGIGTETQIVVNGLPVQKTTTDGRTYLSTYDALHRLSGITDPRTGTTVTTYYAGTSLPCQITDPENRIISSLTYDSAGRVVAKANAFGKAVRTDYNLRSQIIHQWGEAAMPLSYEYNDYGETWKLYTYQNESNWGGVNWPGGTSTSITTWTYDEATGLLVQKADANNESVVHEYNAAGKTLRRRWARTLANDPNTKVTAEYGYNATTGELSTVTYNDGTPGTSYTYTRLGQIDTVTDVTGTHNFVYDSSKPWRLNSESLGSFYGSRSLARLYEETGFIGRPRGLQLNGSGLELEQIYGFLADGRFASITTKAAGVDRTFRYAYEANSALLKATSIDGGHPFTQNRTYETYRDIVTSIDARWSTSAVTRYDYTSDAAGRPDSRKQSGSAFADYGGSTFNRYSYDDRNELILAAGFFGEDVANQGQPLPGRREELTYDAAGNRKTSGRTGVVGTEDQYSVNALNQYTNRENNSLLVWGTAPSGANVFVGGSSQLAGRCSGYWSDELTVDNQNAPFYGQISVWTAVLSGTGAGVRNDMVIAQLAPALESFSYDKDGNLLSDGLWNYQWDAENRLVRMETTFVARNAGVPYRILEFKYDYLGRRVQKRVIDGNNSQALHSRRYLYDGWNLLAEFDAPNGTSCGSLMRSYTWGLDFSQSIQGAGGVGGLLQIRDHSISKSLLLAYGGNGNVAALVNADTGALEAAYEYSAFGELTRSEGTYAKANPFRFSTKFFDEETNLVYYGYRYYEPRQGRFINRDPIEESGGVNLYGFVGNSPLDRWDMLGQYEDKDPAAKRDEHEQKNKDQENSKMEVRWDKEGNAYYVNKETGQATMKLDAQTGQITAYDAKGNAAGTYQTDVSHRVNELTGEVTRHYSLSKGKGDGTEASAPSGGEIKAFTEGKTYNVDGVHIASRGDRWKDQETVREYYFHKMIGVPQEIKLGTWEHFKYLPALLVADIRAHHTIASKTELFFEYAFIGKGGKAGAPVAEPIVIRPQVVPEMPVIIRQGNLVNRVWDSSWTPGSKVSGPFGGSYSPGSALPINAKVGIVDRGLNVPGVANNAEAGAVYRATQDVPALLRTSINGTVPELVVEPQYRQFLRIIEETTSKIPPGK